MRQGFFSSQGLATHTKQPPTLVPHCGSCGLKKSCLTPLMPVSGKGGRGILIVGEAPGRDEDRKGIQFVGQSGQCLEGVLDELGVDMREDCWLTNALICRPANNKIDDLKRIDYCRPNLLKTIRELQPHTIILLGGTAVKSLITWVWKEDAKPKITRWAGWNIPLQKLNTWICPTYHPSYVMREDSGRGQQEVKRLIFKQHLKKAFSHTKRPWNKVPRWKDKIEVITDASAAAEALRGFLKHGSPIAVDAETLTLKPDGEYAEIFSFAVSNEKRHISFPWYGKAAKACKELLESNIPKILANGKFDIRYLSKFGIKLRNFAWDTMIAAHVLDNRTGITSLKYQAFVLLGMEAYEERIKPYFTSAGSHSPNKIRQGPLKEILLYGGLDTLLTYRIAHLQMRQLGVSL